ncbi:hypothetical protein CAP35_00395 [Chitinophagaceae bacterium IBVUCB1]|jgi:hypothetical protein|nr:hypothetical protein CAP35_00395 [Chitinophagaceae bacterium IBVUCB1]
MKKKNLLLTILAGFTALAVSSYSTGPAGQGANRTGSNSTSAGCDGPGCHAANNTALSVTVAITDTANTTPVTSYVAGKKYRLRVIGGTTALSQSQFGFQVSAVRASSTSTQAGTITAGGTSTANTTVKTVGSLQIGEHSAPLTATGAGMAWAYTANLYWTAPAAGAGQVKFFAVINAVNGTGTVSGDAPNAGSLTIGESTSVNNVENNVSFKAFPNPAINTININADGIGTGNVTINVYDIRGKVIGTQNASASNNMLNTQIDCSKWAAGMYYVQIAKESSSSIITVVKQ